MADELLRTAPPTAPTGNPASKTVVALSVAVPPVGVSKPRRGVVDVGGRGGVDSSNCSNGGTGGVVASAKAEWEEERHLDNAFYLLYRWVCVFVFLFVSVCYFWRVRLQETAVVGLIVAVLEEKSQVAQQARNTCVRMG